MTTTATRPGKLAATANTMRSHIVEAGARYSHQRLARGLKLVLSRTVEDNGAHKWRLALARPDVEPSAEEIAICGAHQPQKPGHDHLARRRSALVRSAVAVHRDTR